MEITRRIEFDAGHRVAGHNGHCRNPHGHRYRLEITVDGRVPDNGMVLDFGIVKKVAMDHVHGRFDHAFLVHRDDHELRDALDGHGWRIVETPKPPTAENLAELCAQFLMPPLSSHFVQLVRLRLYETPNAWADWTLQ